MSEKFSFSLRKAVWLLALLILSSAIPALAQDAYATMLDVQVARTDAAHRHTNDGICGILNCWFGFVHQFKPAFIYICI